MAAYDGLDDVQAKTPAVPILGAGLVQLVEPVKDQGQLLGRDGAAFVGDGDVGFVSTFPDLQTQLLALGTEFYRVVDESSSSDMPWGEKKRDSNASASKRKR